jgi:tetratricopeptide (TPR) repeat protein
VNNRSILLKFVFVLLLPLFSSGAFAQHDHSGPQEATPVHLFTGMGNLHHPISTTVPEAQRFFDQGLTFVYAFNHDEALRSFRRAAELDARAAMPWWGIALALGPNYNIDVDPDREKAAYEAVQKAKSLAAAGPENERAYADALAARYSGDPKADLKKLARDYAHAMGELSRRYPDDLDAATLYAESMMDLRPWGLWNLDGTPAEGTTEIISVLSSVLARDPNHIGANHYLVHAVEASPHPEWGLPSADRLNALVPNGGHLVHMPAHIYARVGDYADAIKSNQAAAAVDLAYIQSTGAQGVYPAMYYSHNLHFLAYAAMEVGRYGDADKATSALVENIRLRAQGMPPEMTDGFVRYRTFVFLRFHRWADVLNVPEPIKSSAMAEVLWHFPRGIAFAATGKTAAAEREQADFAAGAAKIPPDQPSGYNTSGTVLNLAGAILDARISEVKGDRKAAIQSLKKAVSLQDGMAYDEPPDWYYPVRESLGGVLLRDGQAAEAEKVFRESLAHNPRNGRSLFGLWQSLKAQDKSADAEWVHQEFLEAWKTADTELQTADL